MTKVNFLPTQNPFRVELCQTRQNIFCVLFVTMMLTLMPFAASAQPTQRTNALDLTVASVGSAAGTAGNPANQDIDGSDEGWMWYYNGYDTYSGKVLVLNGLDLETGATSTALRSPQGTTIVLVGDNTIKSTYSGTTNITGIWMMGDLTITSEVNGNLTVTGGTSTGFSTSSFSCGIFSYYYILTISGDAVVTAIGGTATSSASSYGIYIYTSDPFEVKDNAVLNAIGGAVSGSDGRSYGIGAGKVVTVNDNAVVNAAGGTVTSGSFSGSYGIYVSNTNGDITINDNAVVNATGNTTTVGYSHGIFGGLTINGGTVEAKGISRAICNLKVATGGYSNSDNYTVPDGYNYWTNTLADESGTADSGTSVTGSLFTITSTHKYAKIKMSVVDAETPSIDTQPLGNSYAYGETVSDLTLSASVTDGGTLSYQWYKNGTPPIEVGIDSDSHTPDVEATGTTAYYYCVVTNTNNAVGGIKTASVTSDTVAVSFFKADQAAPTGLNKTDETAAGANDGTITGVTTDMEYKLSTDALYTAIIGTTVTGLAPGTYLVRYAETANHNASPDTSVTINTVSSIVDILSEKLQIYPNPVKDVLQIESGELRIDRVEILDLSGKIVCHFNNLTNQINVSTLLQGIYLIKIETDKGIVTRKFVKE